MTKTKKVSQQSGHDTINPALVDWLSNENKRANDAEVNGYLVLSFLEKKAVRCLTFPGAHWIYEKNLALSMPSVEFSFQGLEVKQDVFENSWKQVEGHELMNAELCLTKNRRSMNQFLGHRDTPWNEDPFDLVYPDWMGTWSQDKKEQVRRMFKRRIFAPTSFLAITLMLARGTNLTLRELEEYVTDASLRVTESISLDARTTSALSTSRVGRLKAVGVSGYIAQQAEQNGYRADPVHLRIYDSYSYLKQGFITPEMSLLYRITDTNV